MCKALPEKKRDHELSGEWRGHRECHLQPDWLLIYRIENETLVLTLTRTGTAQRPVRQVIHRRMQKAP